MSPDEVAASRPQRKMASVQLSELEHKAEIQRKATPEDVLDLLSEVGALEWKVIDLEKALAERDAAITRVREIADHFEAAMGAKIDGVVHVAAHPQRLAVQEVIDGFRAALDGVGQPEPKRCRCDGGAYGVQKHPFLIHPECEIHSKGAGQ